MSGSSFLDSHRLTPFYYTFYTFDYTFYYTFYCTFYKTFCNIFYSVESTPARPPTHTLHFETCTYEE